MNNNNINWNSMLYVLVVTGLNVCSEYSKAQQRMSEFKNEILAILREQDRERMIPVLNKMCEQELFDTLYSLKTVKAGLKITDPELHKRLMDIRAKYNPFVNQANSI